MYKFKILLLIASIFVVGFVFVQELNAQNRADRAVINSARRITGDNFSFVSQTPRGARVYSVSQPSARMLSAIDTGLANLFSVARKNNYANRVNYSDYVIFIARADRTKDSSNQYSPDIAVGAAQYAGSDYDQGGYIYAAGMVLGYNPNAFVIAEHTKNFERVAEAVRNEGEHLVLYHNNRRLYNQTADHSQGGGHPILQ